MNMRVSDRIKVMIADDHPIVCSGLQTIIDSTDEMRVMVTTGDTESTIEKAIKTDLDILILDIGLPGAGGLEVLKTLRNRRPNLKILILSLEEENLYGELTIREGASGYLNKAKPPKEIIESLRKILNGEIIASKDTLEKLKGSPKLPLTFSEMSVARLLIKGERNCDIAKLLNISEKTVNTHRTNIFRKLNVKNRAELIKYSEVTGFFYS